MYFVTKLSANLGKNKHTTSSVINGSRYNVEILTFAHENKSNRSRHNPGWLNKIPSLI